MEHSRFGMPEGYRAAFPLRLVVSLLARLAPRPRLKRLTGESEAKRRTRLALRPFYPLRARHTRCEWVLGPASPHICSYLLPNLPLRKPTHGKHRGQKHDTLFL